MSCFISASDIVCKGGIDFQCSETPSGKTTLIRKTIFPSVKNSFTIGIHAKSAHLERMLFSTLKWYFQTGFPELSLQYICNTFYEPDFEVSTIDHVIDSSVGLHRKPAQG